MDCLVNVLNDKLKQVEVIQKIINLAEKEGEKFLPKELQKLLEKQTNSVRGRSRFTHYPATCCQDFENGWM